MTDRMTWFARHGSALKKVDAATVMSFADFLAMAHAVGHQRNTYGQLLRHDGLLKHDNISDAVTLTANGEKRLKEGPPTSASAATP